jgi:hypothetical protein
MAQLSNNTLEALSRFKMEASAELTPQTKPIDATPPSVSSQPTATVSRASGSVTNSAPSASGSVMQRQDKPKTFWEDFNRVGNSICQRAFAKKMLTPKNQPTATSQQDLRNCTAFQKRDCSIANRNPDGSV